jgi:hypothetical protein
MEHAFIGGDDPADSDGNTAHISEHGLTPEEVASVLLEPNAIDDVSGSTGRQSCSEQPTPADST